MKFQVIFQSVIFLTMESSDGEGLSQLYLGLVDAYNATKWTSRRIKVLPNMEENEKKF